MTWEKSKVFSATIQWSQTECEHVVLMNCPDRAYAVEKLNNTFPNARYIDRIVEVTIVI